MTPKNDACPECGEYNLHVANSGGRYQVQCRDCGFFAPAGLSKDAAWDSWNAGKIGPLGYRRIKMRTEAVRVLHLLQEEVFSTAQSMGWHEEVVPLSVQLMNMHAEQSEAWEWYRKGNPSSDHIPEYSGIEEELADVIIRVLDCAETHGFDVVGAVLAKNEYNKTRTFKHGGKVC